MMTPSNDANDARALYCPEPDERPDLWPWSVVRGDDATLSIGGLSVRDLADTWGTPLYVLDAADLAQRACVWASAMHEEFWDGYGMSGGSAYYAAKAMISTDIVRIVTDAGMGIDTASLGELTCALNAGADPEVVGLHGNNKSDAVIDLAVSAGERGIGRIVIDAPDEVDRIAAVAQRHNRVARVMIRVTTGVHAGGHEFIATAHEDQKFGLSLTSGVAREVARDIAQRPELELVGIHAHIGSQILDLEAFGESARRVIGFVRQLRDCGIACEEIDLGGGYAISYTGDDPVAPSPQTVARTLADAVRSACAEYEVAIPRVSIEPGRSVIGPACVTLYRVGTVKNQPIGTDASRLYVSVDGGMSDNIRPSLYGARYTTTVANRRSSAPAVRARVVGGHCESGDIVIHDVDLPDDIRRGDILAVPATGAYGHVMASNYNMFPRPGTLLVEGGKARWAIRPETVTDVLARDTAARARLRVAVLGAGTVGSQVVRLLEEQREELAERAHAILDISAVVVRDVDAPRDYPIPRNLITTDAEKAIDGADIVIELIGGTTTARTLVARALAGGKSVITGNKALLASAGHELHELAERHHTDLYYEAAVAGAVPIVYGLRESIVGDRISRIVGIVNGTTNYILDEMTTRGTSMDAAIADAQRLGFAEADPSADIDGWDSAAKCALMASLAFHTTLTLNDVEVEGIRSITADDIRRARERGGVVKLLAVAQRVVDRNGVEGVNARVFPAVIPDDHQLASIHGAVNAVMVECEAAGTLVFSGLGAGGSPTASAVVSDLVAAAAHRVLGGRAPRALTYAQLPIIASEDAATAARDGNGLGLDIVAVHSSATTSAEVSTAAGVEETGEETSR